MDDCLVHVRASKAFLHAQRPSHLASLDVDGQQAERSTRVASRLQLAVENVVLVVTAVGDATESND